MPSDIKAVLFDLDGTLLDTHDMILASFRHATQEVLGHSFPEDVLMAKVGQPLETQMRDFTDDEVLQRRLLESYRTYNHAVHDQMVKPFDGIVEMLEALREAGLAMGVVTSKRHALAARGLEVCGLGRFMSCVVGPDDFPAHKPDPGPVVFGCQLLGVQPAECVYVGDSPFDIQAGNAAGCRTIAAPWGMFALDALKAQAPAEIAADPIDVVRLLKPAV